MRKLHLGSKGSEKILGVCSGIAETYDLDPTLVRLVTVLLCLTTAILPIVVIYVVSWIVMPKKQDID